MAEFKGKKVTLNKPRNISKGSPGYGRKQKEVFVQDGGDFEVGVVCHN